ncbi:MAG: polysaccharide deacetylase family protein [Clostridia bacterium]|nr:polysaccharide deacetylase family protein [Clostridia bacterium]
MTKMQKNIVRLAVALALVLALGVTCFATGEAEPSGSLAVYNGANGVQLAWEWADTAEGFLLYRACGDEEPVLIAEATGDAREYTDESAEGGVVYKYTVVAASQDATESASAEIMRLETPEISCTFNNTQGVVFGWKQVAGATEYKLYKNGCKSPFATVAGDISSFTDTDVSHGTAYTYSVEACCGDYTSYPSFSKSYVFVDAPELVSVSNGDGYTCFKWSGPADADGYRVYKKAANGSWSLVTKTSGKAIYIIDRSVKSGDECTYTVQAVKDGCISGYDGQGITGVHVSRPAIKQLYNAKDGLYLSWSAVEGAESYMVYRRDTINTSWKLVYTGSNTYLQDSRVANGVYFAYTVRAVSKYGNYSTCDSKGTNTIVLKKPNMSLGCTPDGVMVSWTKLPSATGYNIYRKAVGDASWRLIKTTKQSDNSYFVDTNVSQGTSYIYTIRQTRGSVLGSYNLTGVKTAFYKAPTVSLSYGSGGVTVTWTKAPVGMGYAIDRRVTGGWKQISVISDLNTLRLVDLGYSKGVLNYYRVRVTGTSLVSNSASIKGFDPSVPMVALTYDDGPYSPVTNRILDTLERYDAKATFFVVGNRVSSYSSTVKRAYNMGCEIANHTYNHTFLTSASSSTISSEISRTNSAVKSITGQSPVIVRAPGGDLNSRVLSTVNYPFVGWDVDTLDWSSRNASSVIAKVKGNVRNGSIVLMHDLYSSTATATETIVPWLIEEGYCLVTVSELMEYKNINFHAGKVYHCAY